MENPCVKSAGCLSFHLMLALIGIGIWVKLFNPLKFTNECHHQITPYFQGCTLVYPEYATLDRDSDEWSQCQQVPVVFAFVMLTINWVKQQC